MQASPDRTEMDDTAFFYSRTLRIIVALAIIIPLAGIGVLIWHFTSDTPEDTAPYEAGLTAVDDLVENGPEEEEEEATSPDDNPLKPIGPTASSRVVSGS